MRRQGSHSAFGRAQYDARVEWHRMPSPSAIHMRGMPKGEASGRYDRSAQSDRRGMIGRALCGTGFRMLPADNAMRPVRTTGEVRKRELPAYGWTAT